MGDPLIFDYYYGGEANQFSFVRIPKILLTEPQFQDLSFGAIITFAVLLDRMNLSIQNRWHDENNRVYIRYKVTDLTKVVGKSADRVSKYLKELEDIGLIERPRVGLGEGKMTFVKNFISPFLRQKALIGRENAVNEEDGKDTFSQVNGQNSEKSQNQEPSKASNNHINRENAGNVTRGSAGNIASENASNIGRENAVQNNTEINNININNNLKPYPNHISSQHNTGSDTDDWIDVRNTIKANLDYDILAVSQNREELDGIVDIMTEVMISTNSTIWIAGNDYPSGMVKERYSRITSSHIEYVLTCFHKNTGKIYNIKKYLQTALFNAPATIDSYYTADVNHDQHGFN